MSFVNYEAKDMVGIITINRPEALNALNSQVLADLDATIRTIDFNTIRAVIITGAGTKSFVAGADIAEMCHLTHAEAKSFSHKGLRVFRKLELLPVPVIAAVNGYALGGGCEMALSCDIRICSENAMFGQPEVTLGITPGFGGTQRLARTIGVGKAKEMIYTAKPINAEEAYRLGLVNAVYPIEELLPQAIKLAGKIAVNAPIAVRACKEAINYGLQVDIDSSLRIEGNIFGSCFETEDQRLGMESFLAKKKVEKFNNK